MESLQRTSTRVLQHLLSAQPTTPGKVLFAWRIAAGPALGRAGTPEWSEDGTLRVRARDAIWLKEMRHARPIIMERLTQLLGANVIRKLELE
jgi:hypothetical protein